MLIIALSDWSEFKNTVISTKKLKLQYAESPDRYEIWAPENSLVAWNISILKDSADGTDFENNYQSTSNLPLNNISTTGEFYTNTAEGGELFILSGAFTEGNITLTDANNWNATDVLIRDITVYSTSVNWDLSICANNSFDLTLPTTRKVVSHGSSGNTIIPVNIINRSATTSLYLVFETADFGTGKFYVTGQKK